jgi:DNA-binding response OmpR family regulator
VANLIGRFRTPPGKSIDGPMLSQGMLETEPTTGELTQAAAPTVLIAEDDVDLREMIAESFVDRGFAVETFADGNKLLDALLVRFDQLGAPPDLVVTDVRMPGRTGLEVIELLRRFDFVTRVIVVTAYADAQTRGIARALNARLFSKPFDLDELIEAASGVTE